LRSNLKLAYSVVAKASRRSHQNNKRYYDLKAKPRRFEVGDLTYLYNPAIKPALTKKFARPWHGPYRVTKKLPELNYEVTDLQGKKQVVHVNRLKKAYSSEIWTTQQKQRPKRTQPKRKTKDRDEDTDFEFRLGPLPLSSTDYLPANVEREPQVDHSPNLTRLDQRPLAIPTSEHHDPSYYPPGTPRSRKELQTTRTEPPLNRSRA
jgi:hypothetical protein